MYSRLAACQGRNQIPSSFSKSFYGGLASPSVAASRARLAGGSSPFVCWVSASAAARIGVSGSSRVPASALTGTVGARAGASGAGVSAGAAAPDSLPLQECKKELAEEVLDSTGPPVHTVQTKHEEEEKLQEPAGAAAAAEAGASAGLVGLRRLDPLSELESLSADLFAATSSGSGGFSSRSLLRPLSAGSSLRPGGTREGAGESLAEDGLRALLLR